MNASAQLRSIQRLLNTIYMKRYKMLSTSTEIIHSSSTQAEITRTENCSFMRNPLEGGCMAHGETEELALKYIKDAVQLWIDTAKEFGDPGRGIFGCKKQKDVA